MAFMLFVALLGAGLAAYGELASHAALREKEAELLVRGEQYREAIASYYRKQQTYPAKLADLLHHVVKFNGESVDQYLTKLIASDFEAETEVLHENLQDEFQKARGFALQRAPRFIS